MGKKSPTPGIRIALRLLGLIGLLMGGFLVWALTPARPMPEVYTLVPGLNSTASDTQWLTFAPGNETPNTGLILYPGGRVDFRAYAPLAQAIASQGYQVLLVRMPLNLAVFNPNAAEAVLKAYPNIEHWAIGGHSLGGAMAAHFVAAHPGQMEGLVLWAAYPAEGDDLSQADIRVLSISATLDGLATPDKILASRSRLPADTVWVTIAGGNHAQFGWYGDQNGDNPATISREEQQEQIVQATVAFLQTLNP